MARYKKKDYLVVVELLEQVNKRLSQCDLHRVDAPAILSDCQEAAITLGTNLEQQGEEGVRLTHILEEYCENLYQLSQKISEGAEGVACADYIQTLARQLAELEEGICKNLPERKEVVFLPYKASMWDSLESIWLAANADPDCIAYVIPIPYYDRNPDNSFGAWHYEGGDFPENVPIVHYDAYDLEIRRPDIIYIHNPYDEYNLVTSVDPRFYSRELKKYTDCLVYVPYCVYHEPDNPDSPQTIDWCYRYITPVMINADKVILQSENFRKAMINTLVANYGESREFWENRIIGIGSPKYDKVFLEDEMLLDIRDSWKKIIWKKDGSKKKVVFYNTSLVVTLGDTEQELKKIESVINYFYQTRDEFVLLWRPHPLMRATIDSMRTELSVRYQEIVDAYKHGGWGIYDDTPCYHTAFALSDAYYGDSSSLVPLYQATGKPLMMQSAEITDYGKRSVAASWMYYDGFYIWITAREFNGLFRMDSVTYKTEFIGRFPGEKSEGYFLFGETGECNGKLYFAPYNAENIAVYDKRSSRFYAIPLRKDICNLEEKFLGVLTCGKYVFIQGCKATTIIRIDSETDEIVYFEDQSKISGKNMFFTLQSCVHDEKAYFYQTDCNSILCIDPSDMSVEYFPVSREIDNDIIIFGHSGLMLKTCAGNMVSYDFETMDVTELPEIGHAKCFCESGQYIYVFSNLDLILYRIQKETGEMVVGQIPKDIYRCCPVGDKIMISTGCTGAYYVFDTESMEVQSVEVDFEQSDIPQLSVKEMFADNEKCNKYAIEAACFNLEDLLEVVKLGAKSDKKVYGNNGTTIHEYVKGIPI